MTYNKFSRWFLGFKGVCRRDFYPRSQRFFVCATIMSIQAISWAFEQTVFPSTCKFILISMANYCNESGQSYPSVFTLSKITGMKDDTVRNAIRRLVEIGIIKDSGQRTGNTGRVVVYQFPDEVVTIPPLKVVFKTRHQSPDNPPPIPPQSPDNPPENGDRTITTPKTSTRRIKTEPSPEVVECRARWIQAYQEGTGRTYRPQKKDIAAARELLLSGMTIEEIETLSRRAFTYCKRKRFWSERAVTLEIFAKRVNEIGAENAIAHVPQDITDQQRKEQDLNEF